MAADTQTASGAERKSTSSVTGEELAIRLLTQSATSGLLRTPEAKAFAASLHTAEAKAFAQKLTKPLEDLIASLAKPAESEG